MYLSILNLVSIFCSKNFFLELHRAFKADFLAVTAIPTIRSSSKCSVRPCTHSSLVNCASNEGVCYDFQTTNGTSFCAPASSCELLDSCNLHKQCASNTSVCIVNSCCAQPVCLPLILVDLCSPHGVTKESEFRYIYYEIVFRCL